MEREPLSAELGPEDLHSLLDIARLLASRASFEEKVEDVVTEMARAIGVWEVALRLLTDDPVGLRTVAIGGPAAKEVPPNAFIRLSDGVAGRAVQTGQIIVANDYVNDPYSSPSMIAQGTRSAVALPIGADGAPVGVLIVGSQDPDQFPDQRVRFLSAVVDALSPLLENARLQEEERLHAEETQVLFSLAQTLAEEGPFEEKATRFVSHLAEILQVNSVTLRLLDDQHVLLRLVAAAGPLLEMLPLAPAIGLDQGLSGIAVRERRIVVSNDYASDTNALPKIVAQEVASGLAVPIRVGDDVLGVIVLSAREPDHFTPRRVRLMEAVAGGVGVLLESARLREKEELRAEELEALFAVSAALAAIGTFRDRVSDAMRRLSSTFPGGAFTLWLRSEKEEGLWLVASSGPPERTIAKARTFMPSGSGILGLAYAEGRVVVSNDYRNDPNAMPDVLGKRVRSAIALPIRVADEVLSVLSAASLKEDFFTPRQVEVLMAVAEGMGSLIESAHLTEQLQLLAVDISPREREVLDYAAEGLTNQMIAQRLGVTQNTIKFHMKNISSKLNLRSRRDLRRR